MRSTGSGPKHRGWIARYAVAGLCVALAVVARGLLDPVIGDRQPFPTFYVAVTIAAWFGGLGPTLFALVLGYLAADWFFIPPHNTFSALNLLTTGTYFFVGLVMALLNHMMHSAQDRAHASTVEARDKQEKLEARDRRARTGRGRPAAGARRTRGARDRADRRTRPDQ